MPVTSLSRRLVPALLLTLLVGCDRTTSPLAVPGDDTAPARLVRVTDPVQDRYIVVLKPRAAPAAATARQMVAAHGGRLHHTYEAALQGFAATLPAPAVEALLRNPEVAYVAEDGRVSIAGQQANPTWGLDRIDQRDLPLNAFYNYGPDGTGVRVYVMDTGIRTAHQEFGGRATVGLDVIGDGQNGQDCNGHGTHVAGTIGGTLYGVAKNVQLVSVRVLDCGGSGAWSGLIAAVDWLTANAQKPAVANLSLGGPVFQPLNDALAVSVASGISYVVAAGNENVDACTRSPASAPAAITVASSTDTDVRSSFSNWGTCVDLFAPGSSITSAWHTSNTATHTISGTSMAAPHVAGVAALHLQGNPLHSPAQVDSVIRGSASGGRISNAGAATPNRLLYSLLTPAPPLSAVPGSLTFTFLRPAAGSLAAGEARDGDARPVFEAAGAGAPRTEEARHPEGAAFATASSASVQEVVLLNNGGGARDWSATSSHAWLTVSPTNGMLASGSRTVVAAAVNAAALPMGTHTASIALSDAAPLAASLSVPVTVHVQEVPALRPGTPISGLSGAGGSLAFFAVPVPQGATSLTISISGGSGDADLYVRYGALPTLSEYDCRPYIPANNETCTTVLPAAGTYYVMLRGYSAYSNVTLTAALGGPPAAPVALSATPATSSSIGLAWTDASSNETGFAVHRRMRNADLSWGAWQVAGTAPANAVTFTDTGLAAATTYQYRVRACNGDGCSAFAGSAQATTLAGSTAPAAPSGLSATVASHARIDLAWADHSADETSFEVRRRVMTDGTWGPYEVAATLPANATAHADSAVAPQTTYQYRVRACNAAGCSAYANAPALTTPAAPTIPERPTGLAAAASLGRIDLTWADNSPNEANFDLRRRLQNTDGTWGAWDVAATLPANTTGYADTGLLPERTYQYRIRACNAAGCSAYTTAPAVTTPALEAVPDAPSLLRGIAATSTRIDLTWTDNSGNETSFDLRRRAQIGGTWGSWEPVAAPAANATAYSDTGLAAATTYQYRIRACNAGGCSAYTAAPAVTTP